MWKTKSKGILADAVDDLEGSEVRLGELARGSSSLDMLG